MLLKKISRVNQRIKLKLIKSRRTKQRARLRDYFAVFRLSERPLDISRKEWWDDVKQKRAREMALNPRGF